MVVKLIPDMSEVEAKVLLSRISMILGIGERARTGPIVLINIENCVRRSACLAAIERHHTPENSECPLGWGDTPEEYIAQYKELLNGP